MKPNKLWFGAVAATVAVLAAALTPSAPWAAPPKPAQDKTAQDKTAQDKTAQDKTAQDKTAQAKTAQAKTAPSSGRSGIARLFDAVNPAKVTSRPKPKLSDPVEFAARIDAEINAKLTAAGLPVSPAASDAEFYRRATLDLTGRIPTAEDSVAFLDSTAANKRTAAVEKLLASPAYGEHMATIWHNLIVARDSNNRNLNTTVLADWFTDRFNQNVGWDRTVHDLMTASGPMDTNPGVLMWLTNTDNNRIAPNKISTLTGELFMGVRIGCAECHNHPFTKWKQTDFWSMAAFFGKVKNVGSPKAGNKDGKVPGLEEAEQPAKNARGPKSKGKAEPTAAPATLNSAATIEIPESKGKIVAAKFPAGAEPPLKRDQPFRPALADWLTGADNPYFAQAAVNRLWAHFFGRGLVHPVDDFHEGNPPSHPLLLKLLAAEFTASGYDVKHLIRCITATQAYQRSSRPVAGNQTDDRLLSHMSVKVMTPEVLYESLRLAIGEEERGGKEAAKKAPAGKKPSGPKTEFLAFFNTAEDGATADEYSHGIPQVLRLMNNKRFNTGGKHVAALISQRAPAAKAVEQMFLATLSRRPTENEAKRFADFLAKNPDAKTAYPQVMWVLINTSEFVLNH